jgi:hypothetical protein
MIEEYPQAAGFFNFSLHFPSPFTYFHDSNNSKDKKVNDNEGFKGD